MAGGPLRVVHAGPLAGRGGVQMSIARFASGLASRGHAVLVVGPGATDGAWDGLLAGVRREEALWGRSPLSAAGASRRVGRLVRRFGPDVVHSHGRGPSLALQCGGVHPDVFTLHSVRLTDRVSVFDRWPLRRVWPKPGRYVHVLDGEAGGWVRRTLGFRASRIIERGHGVEMPSGAKVVRASGGEAGPVVLGFVGRLVAEKEPIRFLEIVERLSAGGMDVRGVMAGDGPLRGSVERHAAVRGGEVEWLGWVDPAEVYGRADLLVMPSTVEGFGLVGAEAIAHGCPVARTRTGGFDAMIVEGRTGFALGGSLEEMATTLAEICGDRDRLVWMRAECVSFAERCLSLDAFVDFFVELYRGMAV